jgi:hypothetical protein
MTDISQESIKEMLKNKVSEKLKLYEEIYTHEKLLDEATVKRIIRVTSKGRRIKKKVCPKGYRLEGDSCVPATSQDKALKKRAIIKANRTKKADASGKRRSIKKRIKALTLRKRMGL